MAKAATSEDLRAGFEEHLEQTQGHVQRLETIFKQLGESPKRKKCRGMEGLRKARKRSRNTKATCLMRFPLLPPIDKISALGMDFISVLGCGCDRDAALAVLSNQLNYVPTLFSYLYRKPAYLLAFLRFNRFACVACFNLRGTKYCRFRHRSKPQI